MEYIHFTQEVSDILFCIDKQFKDSINKDFFSSNEWEPYYKDDKIILDMKKVDKLLDNNNSERELHYKIRNLFNYDEFSSKEYEEYIIKFIKNNIEKIYELSEYTIDYIINATNIVYLAKNDNALHNIVWDKFYNKSDLNKISVINAYIKFATIDEINIIKDLIFKHIDETFDIKIGCSKLLDLEESELDDDIEYYAPCLYLISLLEKSDNIKWFQLFDSIIQKTNAIKNGYLERITNTYEYSIIISNNKFIAQNSQYLYKYLPYLYKSVMINNPYLKEKKILNNFIKNEPEIDSYAWQHLHNSYKLSCIQKYCSFYTYNYDKLKNRYNIINRSILEKIKKID